MEYDSLNYTSAEYVTQHRKTYVNAYPLNGLKQTDS